MGKAISNNMNPINNEVCETQQIIFQIATCIREQVKL